MTTTAPRRGWAWFWGFVAVGAFGAFAILGMLTIGMLVFYPTVAAFVVLLVRGGGGRPLWGLATGAGVTMILVGLGRHTSPATCSGVAVASTDGGVTGSLSPAEVTTMTDCLSVWDPWPFALPGAVLVVVGLVGYVLAHWRVTRAGGQG